MIVTSAPVIVMLPSTVLAAAIVMGVAYGPMTRSPTSVRLGPTMLYVPSSGLGVGNDLANQMRV